MSTALVIALAFVLAGCGSAKDGGDAAATSTVTDGAGAQVKVPAKVSRVVCLTGICDDALLELGLRPVASVESGTGGLLADPHFLGPGASSIPKVGGSFGQENVEDIIAARPDLVVGLAGAQDGLRAAVQKAAPLYLVKVASYQQSVAFLTWLGDVTGRRQEAAGAASRFQAKLDAAKASVGSAKASSLAIFGTDTNFSVGTEKSLIGSVLSRLGSYPWPYLAKGQGGEHEPGQGTYSVEQILKEDPSVIFVETFSFGAKPTAPISEQLKANAVWNKLSAVKDDRVREVNTLIWAEGRGTRCLGIVAEEAAAALKQA